MRRATIENVRQLWDYLGGFAIRYGADPRIYVGLILVTIPPFYLALGIMIRDLAKLRRQEARVSLDVALRCRSLVVASIVLVVVWAVPYVYVLCWGRNLPGVVLLMVLVLLLAGGLGIVGRARRRDEQD